MKFIEIVETVEDIEYKIETLSETKLGLLEIILEEGSDHEFDIINHIGYLVEFIDSYSDENAKMIAESVDGGEVLHSVLESLKMNSTDMDEFINEAVEAVGEIDIELEDEETASVTLLSVVTNTLTEMLGEETVENMPAEMVFDIVESTKELDISENADELDIISLVEEISTKLEESIKDGSIDLDTEDYEGETLAEFLDDYSDTEDLLEEMAEVTDELLAESENEDNARLMGKAKEATIMLEAAERCKKGDIDCMKKKAKAAKEWFKKHNMHGTDFNPKEIKNVTKVPGKLGKILKGIKTANKKYPNEYIRFVVLPAIISNFAKKKGKKRKTATRNKKVA